MISVWNCSFKVHERRRFFFRDKKLVKPKRLLPQTHWRVLQSRCLTKKLIHFGLKEAFVNYGRTNMHIAKWFRLHQLYHLHITCSLKYLDFHYSTFYVWLLQGEIFNFPRNLLSEFDGLGQWLQLLLLKCCCCLCAEVVSTVVRWTVFNVTVHLTAGETTPDDVTHRWHQSVNSNNSSFRPWS